MWPGAPLPSRLPPDQLRKVHQPFRAQAPGADVYAGSRRGHRGLASPPPGLPCRASCLLSLGLRERRRKRIQVVGLARLRRSCHSRIEGARQPGPGSSCEIAASTGLGHSPRSRNALSCLVAAPRCCNFGLKERSLNGGRRDGVGGRLLRLRFYHKLTTFT